MALVFGAALAEGSNACQLLLRDLIFGTALANHAKGADVKGASRRPPEFLDSATSVGGLQAVSGQRPGSLALRGLEAALRCLRLVSFQAASKLMLHVMEVTSVWNDS